MLIRRFSEHDSYEELTSLLHKSYAQLAQMGLRYLATHQNVQTTADRAQGGECYVCEIGKLIVGTIVFEDAAKTNGCEWYSRPDVASFHQFAVLPAFQGQGIGSMLLEKAEQRAVETNAKEIALDTAESAHHLIAYYKKRGYHFRQYVQWGLTNYRSVIMSKPL